MQAGCASVAQVLLPGVRSLLPPCFSHTQAAVRGMSCTVSTDSVVLCRASSGAPLDPHLAAEHCKRSCHKASLLQGSETARPGLANTGESFAQQLKHDLVRSTTGCGEVQGSAVVAAFLLVQDLMVLQASLTHDAQAVLCLTCRSWVGV